MLIINADDWGRSRDETDTALACIIKQRVTSVSAMVFMADSERAAQLAREHKVHAGLHLNLNEPYNGAGASATATAAHRRIVRFLKSNKFAILIYNPFLRRDFKIVFQAQFDEFKRLFGRDPTHIDGHQHRHLCANMLLGNIIPRGQKVRRNFSFWPGEKSGLNRTYRSFADRWLSRRYPLTDFFFSLGQSLQHQRLARVLQLAATQNVELMTHPIVGEERLWLMQEVCPWQSYGINTGSYASLVPR